LLRLSSAKRRSSNACLPPIRTHSIWRRTHD
jgi:hypothetical protein